MIRLSKAALGMLYLELCGITGIPVNLGTEFSPHSIPVLPVHSITSVSNGGNVPKAIKGNYCVSSSELSNHGGIVSCC